MIDLKDADFLHMAAIHPLLAATLCVAAVRAENPDTCFRITSSTRSALQQSKLYDLGITPLRSGSMHELGRAVDLAILTKDRTKALWDFRLYETLNGIIQAASVELHCAGKIEWGGSWPSRDGVHWQINL